MDLGEFYISNAQYHADISAVSHSGLCKFDIAPRVYEWEILMGNKPDPTHAKIFGNWFHTAVLEPHIFKDKYFTDSSIYIRYPNRTKKDYKDAFKDLSEENEGKDLIKHDDWVNIQGMLESIKKTLVSNAFKLGIPELSFCWNDEKTGVKCKTRPDFTRDDQIILEVKTARDASEAGFKRAIEDPDYKLYRQAAMQIQGVSKIRGWKNPRLVWLAVEKTAPWLSKMHEAQYSYIWAGNYELNQVLPKFKECKESNIWPGLPGEKEVTYITPSEWFIKKFQDLEDSQEAHEQTYGDR